MTEEEENDLITCLRNNQDVFAWSKGDIKGVRKVIEHALRLDPKIPDYYIFSLMQHTKCVAICHIWLQ
jgi:hypothetical protein